MRAEYQHPDDNGMRALSFAVRADTVCGQVRAIAEVLGRPATWTARPGEDTSGHHPK